ncbi:MAG TPA: methyltransferase, FxLD system, partial [bacterium]|nr:methyltransferase, FxLD system [bacterium]
MATDSLRSQLVEQLKRSRAITSPAVEAAFRRVLRHEFLPGLALEQVYRDDAIVTRWADGLPSSSSSQPAVMAIMAEQLELKTGHSVLEV